jgi:hypothetical protein
MNRTFRLATVTVALAAMLLRALIPTGWMPAQGASLVICTMQGPMRVAAGDHGKPQKPQDTHHTEVCPFAAAPVLSGPADVAALLPPSQALEGLPQVRAPASAAITRSHTPQSPRAPPFLA